MGFNIRLMTNNSADNVADKNFTTVTTLEGGTLRDDCSITKPTIRITASVGDIQKTNYFYIPQFERYYFLTDCVSVRNGVWDITGKTDVLTTAWDKSNLKQCNGIIKKSEKKWNLFLNDGSFKVYQNPIITAHKFPIGFTTQSFILAVAGSRST